MILVKVVRAKYTELCELERMKQNREMSAFEYGNSKKELGKHINIKALQAAVKALAKINRSVERAKLFDYGNDLMKNDGAPISQLSELNFYCLFFSFTFRCI